MDFDAVIAGCGSTFSAAQMPLAEMGGSVACTTQQLRDSDGRGIQPVGHVSGLVERMIGEVAMDQMSRRVMGRHERAAAGRANRRGDVELLEPRSLAGKTVQVRSLDIRMAGKVRIPPALIVGQYEQDIRPFCFRRAENSRGCEQQYGTKRAAE